MFHPSHRLRSKTFAFFLSFLAAALFFTSAAQSPTAAGVASINMDELREKLTYIASEKFKGRGNGSPELSMAAEYIAGVFEKNGLKPAKLGERYYQSFDMYTSGLGPANDVVIRGDKPDEWKLKARTDFIPERWSVSASISGPMVFLENPARPQIDLRGKIAVIPEGQGPKDDPEFPENAAIARTLEAAGAIGVIVMQDPMDVGTGRITSLAESFRNDLPTRLTPMGTVDSPDYPTVPVVVFAPDVARQLIPALNNPRPDVEATITVDVVRKTFRTQNVVGLVEGTDPVLRNELIVVGAHYDHDGESAGQIWYGADDDGSGVAALLELAEAFGNGKAKPARSVLLCAWAGEEKGLLGSRYYVSHPIYPLNRTVAMFQMDMIGRNEEHSADEPQGFPEERASENTNTVNIIGSAFSPDLKSIISRLNDQISLTLRFRYDFRAEDLLRRSDQWSFLSKGIPAIFFFAGLHPDYHTPRDTAAKINYPKLERITRLVYLAAFEIATNSKHPGYIKPVQAQVQR